MALQAASSVLVGGHDGIDSLWSDDARRLLFWNPNVDLTPVDLDVLALDFLQEFLRLAEVFISYSPLRL